MHSAEDRRPALRTAVPRIPRLVAIVVALFLISLPALAATEEGDDLLSKARRHWTAKEFDQAAETYKALRDRHREHPFVTSGNAQFWVWACLGNAGKIAEEIVEIERFLKKYPKHRSCGYALYFLGQARRKTGDEAGAQRAFDELVKKYPDDPMVAHVPEKDGDGTKGAGTAKGAAGRGKAAGAAQRPRSRQRTLDVDFIDYAHRAADWLASIAEENAGGIAWPEHEGESDRSLDFYSGAAGPCLFFLNMARLTGDERYRAMARKAARHLQSSVRLAEKGHCWSSGEGKKPSPGLYTGAAGIGAVFLRLHREWGGGEFLTQAKGAADWIVATADRDGARFGWKEDTDIISGAAGIGLFLLEMHAATEEKEYLDCARGAGEWLIARAVAEKNGLKWRAHASLDRYYTGFSHGTAGIAFFLARLFERTGERRYLDHAEKGARWLKDSAVRDGKGLKWYHYAPGATERFQTGWCHGPAGTGRLFLELFRITGKNDHLKVAKKGATWLTAHLAAGDGKAPFYGLSACCGAAGIGDWFLDLFLASGDDACLELAVSVAERLIDRAHPAGKGCRWTNSERADKQGKIYYGTSHMTGAAGVGSFFLKLDAVLGNREHLFLPFCDGIAHGPPAKEKRASRNQPDADYVVLTNLSKGDPYYQAASRLASHRRARIVPFDPARMSAARRVLARLAPRYVAIVLKPADIDANLQRSMIALSTRIDDDPFCDFAFGFITGPTARDAIGLVDRAVRVEKKGIVKRIVSASVASGIDSYAYDDTRDSLSKELGFSRRQIYWSCVEKDPDVLDFVDEHIAELEGAGVVHLGGCGDPEGIWLFSDQRNRDRSKHWPFDPKKVGHDPKGEMPRILAKSFRGLNLDSAVVWSGTCHCGVPHRAFVEGDIVSTFGRVDHVTEYFIPKGKSLLLAILGAGPSAFLAPIGANHGYACIPESYRAMATGMPLGDVMRTRYNEIIFAAGGKLDVSLFEPGTHPPRENAMRGGGVNRTLFGDPLFRPFPDAGKNWFTVETHTPKGFGYRITVTVTDTRSSMFWDMFGDDRKNAERIYVAIPVPDSVGSPGTVTCAVRDPEGTVIRTTPARWATERIDGRTLLHLQVNAPRETLGQVGTKAVFMVFRETTSRTPSAPR